MIGQAIVAAIVAGLGVLYALAAGSPSNTSPLAGLGVAVGVFLAVFGVCAALVLGTLAVALRRDGTGSTIAAVVVEGGLVLAGLSTGSAIGWAVAASAVLALAVVLGSVRRPAADDLRG